MIQLSNAFSEDLCFLSCVKLLFLSLLWQVSNMLRINFIELGTDFYCILKILRESVTFYIIVYYELKYIYN